MDRNEEKDVKQEDTARNTAETNTESEAERKTETEQNSEPKKDKSDKKSKKTDKPSEELKKLRDDYNALNDRYLRTLAEYDNFRKRTQKDLDSRVSNTKVDVLSKILPVVDNFERAAFNADADAESYRKGIEMTVKQFMEILKNIGVEEFGAAGEQFDPNIHNGVMHVEDENFGENEIADVFMKGYRLGDKIIRPATVKVAN